MGDTETTLCGVLNGRTWERIEFSRWTEGPRSGSRPGELTAGEGETAGETPAGASHGLNERAEP
jgi:hypothetical protein